MILATTETLSLMRYNSGTFIAGYLRNNSSSFLSTTHRYGFDKATRIYVRCVYGLVTAKSEYIFCNFLHPDYHIELLTALSIHEIYLELQFLKQQNVQ
ncbi:hypothetical protein HZS_1681 [Henneguya salminicola]|nr:hypothetical protein HZS_1681 [Henneguya salminicola]